MTSKPSLFSRNASSFIKEIYKDKQSYGIVNAMHDVTFGKGQISMLVSNPEAFDFFYQNQIPMICTDETGRTLAEGVYINKTLEQSYPDCSVLMPLLPKKAPQFNQNYGQNSLHIVTREKDCQHLESLFFDLNENDFLHWVVNNGQWVQNLLAEYRMKAKDIILEAKAPENRVVLPNSHGFFNRSVKEETMQLSVIHRHMHVPVHLSRQQSRCLVHYMQGYTAKEIGLRMNISNRTVEHYLVEIKRKLGYGNRNELMRAYYEQLSGILQSSNDAVTKCR